MTNLFYFLNGSLSDAAEAVSEATTAAESSGGFHLSGTDITLILVVVLVAAIAALFFLSRWASNKYDTQQTQINKMKQQVTIYVISKKHDKPSNVNLPKVVMEQIPKLGKQMKMYFVQAKIGPQIVTLITEKNVYNAIPVKKNVKAEIAGLYIVSIAGLKSAAEVKQEQKAKKQAAKAREKAEKAADKSKKKK
ncbi:MAG: hypothetical protein LUG66_03720 [Clostridiales bacterium]|nr:hypothetical protein [Clostridiales bacterium]